MLSAKEAHKISNSKLLRIMKLIEEGAYKGITFLYFQYFLPDEIINVLQDYGYKVEKYKRPIYCEDHYGKVIEPTTYKEETKVSW